MSDPNSRKEKRTPVTLKIKFKSATLDQFIERYSVDVSQGGIFIRTKEPLGVGTQLRFEFQLQDASPLIAGEGTVVWTRENDPSRVGVAPGMGVRFDRLAPESQSILTAILAKKSTGAPEPKFDAPDAARPAEGPRRTVMGMGPVQPIPPAEVAAPVVPAQAAAGKGTVPARPKKDDFTPSLTDQTPLPKPMPFSNADDDFSEEAFNQPTRVAGSFEDLLRKAEEEAAQGANGASATAKAEAEAKKAAEDAAAKKAAGEAAAAELAAKKEAEEEAAKQAALKKAAEETAARKAADEAQKKAAAAAKTAAEEAAAADVIKRAATGTDKAKQADDKKPEAKATAASSALAEMGAAAKSARADEPRTLPSVEHEPARKGGSKAPVAILGVLLAGGAAFAAYKVLGGKKDAAGEGQGTASGSQVETPPQQPVASVTPDAAPPPTKPDAGPAAQPTPGGPPQVQVAVTVTPAGAKLTIDGKDVGIAPGNVSVEASKTVNLLVTKDCFADKTIKLDGTDKPVTVTLAPLPRVLRVTSDPPGAQVLIDGAGTGKLTPADVPLRGDPAKPHTITFKKAGYDIGTAELAADAACATDKGKGVSVLDAVTLTKKAPKVPVEKPPLDKPPGATPPVDKPPVDKPPVDKPPVEPADKPPADKPPADKPPADKPPADKPPEKPPEKPPGEEHTPDWMKDG